MKRSAAIVLFGCIIVSVVALMWLVDRQTISLLAGVVLTVVALAIGGGVLITIADSDYQERIRRFTHATHAVMESTRQAPLEPAEEAALFDRLLR